MGEKANCPYDQPGEASDAFEVKVAEVDETETCPKEGLGKIAFAWLVSQTEAEDLVTGFHLARLPEVCKSSPLSASLLLLVKIRQATG